MSDQELLTILLRAASEELPGGAVTSPGPDLLTRARRRLARRRAAVVAAIALAVVALAVPATLLANGFRTTAPQPATSRPSPYPTAGPGTAAEFARGGGGGFPAGPHAEGPPPAEPRAGKGMSG